MTTTVAVALELGPSDEQVLGAAIRIAAALGARLHVVHVAPPEPDFVGYEAGPDSVRDAVAGELRDEHRRVDAAVGVATARGVAASGRLVRGPTAPALERACAQAGAELVVVGRHARGALADAIVGSTATALMRGGRVPVLVVPLR